VTGCRGHRDLVGAYVLGALEPSEMDDLRRHLDACESCAAEERRLATLPALLDHAHADDTVASPSPALEDAILDRFVRERAKARRPARRWRDFAIATAAAAVIGLVLALVLLPGGSDPAYARAELWSMPGNTDAAGTAELAEVEAGTRVKLRARDLPTRDGSAFELWCVRNDGRWVSGGTFHARRNGTAAAELTAAVHPGDYHVVVVTRRTSTGKPGAEILRGRLTY
jgi:anti-sigma-K factor RskA